MGLTSKSTGLKAIDKGLYKINSNDKTVIALAGNPNVGKSTVFNALTGLRQHTGNWAGKTVTSALGAFTYNKKEYLLVDLPGTYSLMAHSHEEEVARDFICFGGSKAVIVVCDATCLERNLNLVLQTLEITKNVILCLNLMDEAAKKHIYIDTDSLSAQLGIPVIATSARSREGLDKLLEAVEKTAENNASDSFKIRYIKPIEKVLDDIKGVLNNFNLPPIDKRWLALRLLDCDDSFKRSLNDYLKEDIFKNPDIIKALNDAYEYLNKNGIDKNNLKDKIVASIVLTAEGICTDCVRFEQCSFDKYDRKLDKILTGRLTGIPIMLILLAGVFFLTITVSNYPSQWLSDFFLWFEAKLSSFLLYLHTPETIYNILIFGVYRVVSWVVAVMLPPMAIFFPLFTLLEDFGYLPRVAFNLDHHFKKANACGKQALTMCMGFGCNAAGVVGCRIIDSPRERLIATLTNCFVPCNGRFPALIAVISMFLVCGITSAFQSALSALILTAVILFGILLTFLVSKLLSKTIIKGVPSSFTLELPPYRRPQILKVLVRSLLDRTVFVLGRAVISAIPAGVIIWIMANVNVGDISLLNYIAGILDPFGHLIGLDGVIILAFILGFPANEIVIPIIMMAYMSTGTITEYESLAQLKTLFVDNGWTIVTAINMLIFTLMHFPCSTTCLTIRKETKSLKWTLLSIIIPTALGILICLLLTQGLHLFGIY